MRYLLLFALALLAACDALPRDPNRTLDHITASRQLRVGWAGPGPGPGAGAMDSRAAALVAALAEQTAANPRITQGAAEPLIAALARGDLDLVVGLFAKDSPLATEVAFGPPLGRAGSRDAPIEIKAAARNGENRWIMQVESASRRVARTGVLR
jgi:hypothetical protein